MPKIKGKVSKPKRNMLRYGPASLLAISVIAALIPSPVDTNPDLTDGGDIGIIFVSALVALASSVFAIYSAVATSGKFRIFNIIVAIFGIIVAVLLGFFVFFGLTLLGLDEAEF